MPAFVANVGGGDNLYKEGTGIDISSDNTISLDSGTPILKVNPTSAEIEAMPDGAMFIVTTS